MQKEPAIETSGAPGEKSTKPRRRLRKALKDFARAHEGFAAFVFSITIVGILVGSIFTALAIWKHNGRTQAVQRAMMMDGEVYTIKGVSYNWVGDTRLFLENERGEDKGWVMIHMNNPFTSEVNPLYLALSDKRHEPLPFPMKVRVRRRVEAWSDEVVNDTKENFTGSFLEFEKLDQPTAPLRAK